MLFRTAVFLNGYQLARGHGPSKKDAEESAAKIAMDQLMRTHHTIFVRLIFFEMYPLLSD